jgi:hypothetical protein
VRIPFTNADYLASYLKGKWDAVGWDSWAVAPVVWLWNLTVIICSLLVITVVLPVLVTSATVLCDSSQRDDHRYCPSCEMRLRGGQSFIYSFSTTLSLSHYCHLDSFFLQSGLTLTRECTRAVQ